MCYAVFIATATPQKTTEFIENVTQLYLEQPSAEQWYALNSKFTLPYIYYVGADTQCSCGFEFHSELYNNDDWQDSKASPQALLNFLNKLTATHYTELYCCWDGDWYEPVAYRRIINSRDVKLDNNYFKLIERELIRFE